MKKYLLSLIILTFPVVSQATEFMQFTQFEIVQSQIKYSLVANNIADQKLMETASDEITYLSGSSEKKSGDYKSPGKAFAMSLIVPGWGQHYTGGSKIKSLAFFGTEVASWFLYFKWEKDADDLTDVYEAFNNAHWIEARYDSMIAWTYDALPDGSKPEISHHLPDTKTQQYYEMTGKYDQFVWGWDDALLLSDSSVYGDYDAINYFQQVVGAGVPDSPRRTAYEIMRDDANNKYDQARKMIYVSMLNRMFSAFEAMIAAKKHNKKSGASSSNLSAEVSLKNYYVQRDTPFITLKMKF